MQLDLRLFGNKIQRYREQLNMDLTELAFSSGINETRLKELEEGLVFPTGDEVLILSDIFKCDYKFFISNEILLIFERTENLFRRHGKSFSTDDRKSVLEFIYLCECENYLINTLDRKYKLKKIKINKQGTFYKGHGIQAADELRRALEIKKNEVPLDVFYYFRKLGIHIFRRKLGNSNISGLFIKHPDIGKCVLVNYDEDYYRQRFTAAHEVGHALLDDEKDYIVSYKKWDNGDLVEIRANSFASNFLVPKTILSQINLKIKEYWSRENVLKIANQLKINTETLAISLFEANLISKTKYNEIKSYKIPISYKTDPELWITDTIKQREKRKFLLEKGLSSYYVKLCIDAYYQGSISGGKLAEMLLCSEKELLELVNIFGGAIFYGN